MEKIFVDLTDDDGDHVPSTTLQLSGVTRTLQSIEIDENHQQAEVGSDNDSNDLPTEFLTARYARSPIEGFRSRTISLDPDLLETGFSQNFDQEAHFRNKKRSFSTSTESDNSSSSDQSSKRQKAANPEFAETATESDRGIDEEETDLDTLGRSNAAAVDLRSTSRNAAGSSRLFPHVICEDDHGDETVVDNNTEEEIVVDSDEGEDIADDVVYSTPHQLQISDDDIQFISSISRSDTTTPAGGKVIDKIKKDRTTCAEGKTVELYNGDFVRIVTMFENQDGDIRIIGHLFRRHNELGCSKWPRRTNEVVLITVETLGHPMRLTTISMADVRRNRHLILTNQVFPSVSRRTHPDSFSDAKVDREYGPLFCRWRHNQVMNIQGKLLEESIERLPFSEADNGYEKAESRIRINWRGKTPRTTQYTFADAFCGAGGASCAADQAGLTVQWGVDLNQAAMQTYALNFAAKGTNCLDQDIFNFITQTRGTRRRVDILHMSPPCQPYSPAHTVDNLVQDEKNQAALFSVGELLDVIKPRVATLEETFGLVNRHKVWFNALIKMFLDRNYSVRWKTAHLEEYGLPQRRRRLLILAAAPGEVLPPFPEATHGENGILRPYNTIYTTINDIPLTATHHDVATAAFAPSQYRAPFDAHTLAQTITTSGGQNNYHPSGVRNYTIREYASLQCFPVSYKFANVGVTAMRRQIGNAVPPFVFKKIYREIIKTLKETDRQA